MTTPAPNTPRVSVGLPVYNGEPFLARALDSIQSQSFADLEIIVSDNGSTDGTEEICRRAARQDERIRYLRSPINRGGAWNYMRVARAATAPLFTWMAADDIKEPGFVQECVQALDRAGPAAVFACTRAQLIDGDGTIFESLNDTRMGLDAPTAHQRIANLLRAQASHVLYGVIRTPVLRRTRGLLAMVGDDMVLLTELLCRGTMALADEQAFLQRRHRAQLSLHGQQQVMWHAPQAKIRFAFPQVRLNAELYRAVARSPLPPAERVRCWWQIAPHWILPRWRGMARDLATAAGLPEPEREPIIGGV